MHRTRTNTLNMLLLYICHKDSGGLKLKRTVKNIVIPSLFFYHDIHFAFGSLVLKYIVCSFI